MLISDLRRVESMVSSTNFIPKRCTFLIYPRPPLFVAYIAKAYAEQLRLGSDPVVKVSYRHLYFFLAL